MNEPRRPVFLELLVSGLTLLLIIGILHLHHQAGWPLPW